MTRTPLQLSPGVAWRRVDDTIFAISEEGRLHTIRSAVGAFIWEHLERGDSTRDSLLDAIVERFAVAREVAAADLDEFLANLRTKGLLAP